MQKLHPPIYLSKKRIMQKLHEEIVGLNFCMNEKACNQFTCTCKDTQFYMGVLGLES
jgi:hypothetical protein